MDVTSGTVNAAMNCIASLAIEELASAEGLPVQEAAQRFLASRTAERLFDESLKMWGDGPSALVDDFLAEAEGPCRRMVDERSVRDRASAPKLSGRPKLGQKDLLALSAHTLMNQDHPVLDFTYDRKQKRARIERVHDEALWGPLGMGRRARKPREGWRPPVPNEVDLARWLKHRYMPPLRPEAARVLRETGEPSTDMLMFSSLGLNLSDQYELV